MDRLSLERRQVWIYLGAIVGGLWLGTVAPGVGPRFEVLLWPALAALLYTRTATTGARLDRQHRCAGAIQRMANAGGAVKSDRI